MKTKLYQIKKLAEITDDYFTEIEVLSTRFDKREPNAAGILAYTVSRDIEKLNALNDVIKSLVTEVEELSPED